jgi:hypothetical protein
MEPGSRRSDVISRLWDRSFLAGAFLLAGLWFLVGVFPLEPVFGDGIEIANGATQMARTEFGPNPLAYRYSQHPGAHVVLAVFNRYLGLDAHTTFLAFSAISAAIFIVFSALLISRLVGCPWGLAGLGMLLFQEATAAAYYANTNVLAGAIGISAIYLLDGRRDGMRTLVAAGVLVGISLFIRLDAALLALVVMPVLYRGGWTQMILQTTLVAVVSVLTWALLFIASGASIAELTTAVTFKQDLFTAAEDWQNTVRSHISYFSLLCSALIAVGTVSLAMRRQWRVLAIVAAGVLPFYLIFPDGVDTPRYLYYATPFWASLAVAGLWSIGSFAPRLQIAMIAAVAFLFVGQYVIGYRQYGGPSDAGVHLLPGYRTADGLPVQPRLWYGHAAVSPGINGGRLSTGLLYAPVWHQMLKRRAREENDAMYELLVSKQDEAYHVHVMGWTPATSVRWSLLRQGYELKRRVDDPDAGTSIYEFERGDTTVIETHYRFEVTRRALQDPSASPLRQVVEPGSIFLASNRRMAETVLDKDRSYWEPRTSAAYERTAGR